MTELHPVAASYREVRRTGALDYPAYRAPLSAHVRLIRNTSELMWDGVGSPRLPPPAWKAAMIPSTPEYQRRSRPRR